MAICVACGLQVVDGVLSVDNCTDGAIGCGNTTGDTQCIYTKLQPGGGVIYDPSGTDQFGNPNGGLRVDCNVVASCIGAAGGPGGNPANCEAIWNSIGSPVRTTAETGVVDTASGFFNGSGVNDTGEFGATISTSLTNPSNCKPMTVFGSYYGGAVFEAAAGTVGFTIVFQHNINGGGFSSPFRVGIGFPGMPPRGTHEVIQESQGLGFFRQIGTIAPGASFTYDSALRIESDTVVNGRILFVDRVISLLGFVEF